MSPRKTIYLANPCGFSRQQREGPLHELVVALEALGAEVWEPFARNNQVDRAVRSVAEIADPDKALARWLRREAT